MFEAGHGEALLINKLLKVEFTSKADLPPRRDKGEERVAAAVVTVGNTSGIRKMPLV